MMHSAVRPLSQAKAMAKGSRKGPREIESDSNTVEADRGCSIDRSSGAACFPGPGCGCIAILKMRTKAKIKGNKG